MQYLFKKQLARFVISVGNLTLSYDTSNLNIDNPQDAECTLTLSSQTFLSTRDASAVMMPKC